MLTEASIEERLREAICLRNAVTRAPGWKRPEPDAKTPAQPPEQAHTIGHLADTLSWLEWLEHEDAALVQARLEGARWKMICWRFGISRPTAHRRWRHALAIIAWRLNGNGLPAGCSRRRFMQLTAALM